VRYQFGVSGWEPPEATHSEHKLVRAQADGSYWQEHGMAPRPELLHHVSRADDGRKRWQTLRDAIADLPEPLGDRVEHSGWVHHYG
jgi:DNA (cytosine-5)-methyltransferase 1